MDKYELSLSHPHSPGTETLFRVQVTSEKEFVAKFQMPISDVGRLLKGESYVECEGLVTAPTKLDDQPESREELTNLAQKIAVLRDALTSIRKHTEWREDDVSSYCASMAAGALSRSDTVTGEVR